MISTASPIAGFRNIHFAAPATPVPAEAAPLQPSQFTGRRRWVTRSPDDEFAARDGEVEPLAPELCALILFRKQKVQCTRDGLEAVIQTDGAEREVKRKFWHENSLCCQPAMLGKDVFVVYNRHDAHCVYVFDADGALIEAVPEKELADFFAPGAELAKHKRHQDHVLKRLSDLHTPDTLKAIEAAAANAAQMVKVVHTFPAPAGATQPTERVELVKRDSLARDQFASAKPDPLATHRAAIARGIEQHEEAMGARRGEIAVSKAAAERVAEQETRPAAVLAQRAEQARAAAQDVPPAWM